MQPLSPDRSLASAGDHATYRQMLAGGSKTFSRLVFPCPGVCAIRPSRSTPSPAGGRRRRLRETIAAPSKTLLQRLDDVYDGKPANAPADRAFADAVAQFEIPRRFAGLIEGFLWDVEGGAIRLLRMSKPMRRVSPERSAR